MRRLRLLDNILTLINGNTKQILKAFYTMEEPFTTIQSMSADSAASPNGFNGFLYL